MKGRCLQLTKPGQVPFHVGVPIAVRLEGVPAGLGVSVTDDAGNFYNRVESGGFITLGKGGKAATGIMRRLAAAAWHAGQGEVFDPKRLFPGSGVVSC